MVTSACLYHSASKKMGNPGSLSQKVAQRIIYTEDARAQLAKQKNVGK